MRLYNIGAHGFWTDEYFHVFAARSYLSTGQFTVPYYSGEYRRALPITLITTASFKLFGESESSARVFFALANILFMVLSYAILRSILSEGIALIFAAANAFSVISIQLSQECRMYTLFQLFYFLMSVYFIRGLESDQTQHPGNHSGWRGFEARHGISFAFLASAACFGLAAMALQWLAYNFALVIFGYCLILFIYEAPRAGLAKSLSSKYGLVLLVLAGSILLIGILAPEQMNGVVKMARDLPEWNRRDGAQFEFYRRVITDSHPILWVLYPLGACVVIIRFGRKGLFFVLSFVLLFLVHAFAFARKSERYIFYILPYFIVVAAAGAEFLIVPVLKAFRDFAHTLSNGPRRLLWAAALMTVTMTSLPIIKQPIEDAAVAKFPDWKGLDPELVQTVKRDPAVTTDGFNFVYYFGKIPDFILEAHAPPGNATLTNVDELKEQTNRHPNLSLVTYRSHWDIEAFVTPAIKDFVLREFARIDHEEDSRIMIFRKRR